MSLVKDHALRALRRAWRLVKAGVRLIGQTGPKARGVTVYTGSTAEHYDAGESWYYDDRDNLNVVDWRRRMVATYLAKTWLRVEAGPYVVGAVSPHIGEPSGD